MLHCNAGTVLVTMKGDLRGYGTVWYHPNGISNILSLNNVHKKYRVTFDSGNTEEQGLVVVMGRSGYLDLPKRGYTTQT